MLEGLWYFFSGNKQPIFIGLPPLRLASFPGGMAKSKAATGKRAATTAKLAVTKNVIFLTTAQESLTDPLHDGEFAYFNWTFQMFSESAVDGSLEDASYFVSKLVVQLHPSFANSTRGKRSAAFSSYW